MFKIEINNNKAWCTEKERLTTGLVGEPISFEFSSEWDELTVYAVFRAYDTQITVPITDLTEEYEIPANVLTKSGVKLFVGFYGYDVYGNRVISSLFADLGLIHEGADPESADNFVPIDMEMYSEIRNAALEAAASAAIAQDAAIASAGGAYAANVSFSIRTADGHLIETISVGQNETNIDLGIVTAYGYARVADVPYTESIENFEHMLAVNASDLSAQIEELSQGLQDTVDELSANLEQRIEEETAEANTKATNALTTAQNALNAANAVGTNQLSNSAVTTQKIANGAVTYAKTDGTTIQKKLVKMSLSLASGKKSWSLTATGIDSSSWVLVSPSPGSFDEWVDKGVRCSGQGSNTLSFSATSNTTKALTAYVVAVPGG